MFYRTVRTKLIKNSEPTGTGTVQATGIILVVQTLLAANGSPSEYYSKVRVQYCRVRYFHVHYVR